MRRPFGTPLRLGPQDPAAPPATGHSGRVRQLISLDIIVWSKLVPLQARWDYLLRLIYGCAGGALLTLAFVLDNWPAPALFTGILTMAGIVQTISSAWKYHGIADQDARDHAGRGPSENRTWTCMT